MATLQRRAKHFSTILTLLFAQQKIGRAKLVKATRAARHLSLGVRLANPMDLKKGLALADNLAYGSNVENVLAIRDGGLLLYQFQLNQGHWESYTRQDLPDNQTVGLGEGRQPVQFDFIQPHSLVAGSTGSGKTETLKSILIALTSSYSPTELKLVVIDQKNVLSAFSNEAHLSLPIAVENEAALNAVSYIYNQLIERKTSGNVEAYKLALVIDEVSLLPKQSIDTLALIVKLGREYQIHCIVGNQRASQKELPKILDNLNNRFVGLVDNAQTSAMLTGHAGLDAHKLTGQGDFLHVVGGSAKRFQVAQITKQDIERLERAEITPAGVAPVELIEVSDKPVGRPKNEVQPNLLAQYFFHGPNNISINQAKQLGLSRAGHSLHKQFCIDFVTAYRALKGI